MSFDRELCRQQVRQAMRESVGKWRAHSLKEAAKLAGLHPGTLYQIASGENVHPENHLARLLEIPTFADRLMSIKGHACAYIGNEQGCGFEAIGSVMQAAGVSAKAVADQKITNAEKQELAEAFHRVVSKCQAFLHRFRRERLTGAGA